MSRGGRTLLVGGLTVALLIVLLLAPNASMAPDGLERVAADEGFADAAQDTPFELFPGYAIPGVDNEAASRVLAGLLGTLAVTTIVLTGGSMLRRRTRDGAPRGEGGESAGARDASSAPLSRQP